MISYSAIKQKQWTFPSSQGTTDRRFHILWAALLFNPEKAGDPAGQWRWNNNNNNNNNNNRTEENLATNPEGCQLSKSQGVVFLKQLNHQWKWRIFPGKKGGICFFHCYVSWFLGTKNIRKDHARVRDQENTKTSTSMSMWQGKWFRFTDDCKESGESPHLVNIPQVVLSLSWADGQASPSNPSATYFRYYIYRKYNLIYIYIKPKSEQLPQHQRLCLATFHHYRKMQSYSFSPKDFTSPGDREATRSFWCNENFPTMKRSKNMPHFIKLYQVSEHLGKKSPY